MWSKNSVFFDHITSRLTTLQVCFASRWQPCVCVWAWSRAVGRPGGGNGSLQQTGSTAKPLGRETAARQTNALKRLNPFFSMSSSIFLLSCSNSSWPSPFSSPASSAPLRLTQRSSLLRSRSGRPGPCGWVLGKPGKKTAQRTFFDHICVNKAVIGNKCKFSSAGWTSAREP